MAVAIPAPSGLSWKTVVSGHVAVAAALAGVAAPTDARSEEAPAAGRLASAEVDTRREFLMDLPPPPRRVDFDADQRLELALVVNGVASGIVASVLKRGDRFQVRAEDLRNSGMEFVALEELIFLDGMEDVVADYDASRQQLHLTVSPGYLPAQRIGEDRPGFQPAQQDSGALLNYDLYASGGGGGPANASLWHEIRVFGPAGVFSSTAMVRTGTSRPFIRYDTHWRWSDERTMTTVEAGDVVTRTVAWAPAIRLGGAQVSRDFSVRPDVVTYPLPEFAGSAALPSTVDLVVNGQRIAGSRVNPGPFTLDTLPPINGRGEANLIVTDIHGRSVATAMPFYVGSTLLRAGLTDYSVAAGALRRNFGLRSFDYGALAATAYVRRGLTAGMTLELRAEATAGLRVAGAGGVFKVGNLGIVSASYSRSLQSGPDGGELTVGYEYQDRGFTIGLRHSRQDGDYRDIAMLDGQQRLDGPAFLAAREQVTAATASVSLGSAGTIGVGYFDVRREERRGRDGETGETVGGVGTVGTGRSNRTTRIANGSWATSLWGDSRLYASVSREFAERNWLAALTVTIPLGSGMASGGLTRDDLGGIGLRADYTRPVPTDGGFGWNASAYSERGNRPYLRGDVLWRTQPIQLRAGAYGRDSVTGWFGASGALVFMDDALFVSNRVADGFAVVNTGQPGIPVLYENQLIGETNRRGQLLVPSATAYYPARYDIDTLSLPANVKASVVSQRLAVAAGSGHIVHFAVERMTAARAVVTDPAGELLPAGAIATINGGTTTYVGWDGMLFLENVAAHNVVQIQLPDGADCRMEFAAAAGGDDIIDLGKLTCRP